MTNNANSPIWRGRAVFREQPKCSGCTHRRIFHTQMVDPQGNAMFGGRSAKHEEMVPCTICGCTVYTPEEKHANV